MSQLNQATVNTVNWAACKQHFFLTGLEAGKSQMMGLTGSGPGEVLMPFFFFAVSSLTGKGEGLSGVCFSRPHNPVTSPTAPFPNTTVLGIRFPRVNLGGPHSVHSNLH